MLIQNDPTRSEPEPNDSFARSRSNRGYIQGCKKVSEEDCRYSKKQCQRDVISEIGDEERRKGCVQVGKGQGKEDKRDLGCVRSIKGEDGKMLVEEAEIRERWQSYFSRLFNGE